MTPKLSTRASQERKVQRTSEKARVSSSRRLKGKRADRLMSIIWCQVGRLLAKVPPPLKMAALSIRTLEKEREEKEMSICRCVPVSDKTEKRREERLT